MTGAGRLSSGPQPVTASAAPLFLSPASSIADADEIPLPTHLPSGMEARRVKTRLKPGFSVSRQPGPAGRRQTTGLPISKV